MNDPTSPQTTSEKATSQNQTTNGEATGSPLQGAEQALATARQSLDAAMATGTSADVLATQDVVDRAQNQVDALRTSVIEADTQAYAATLADDLQQTAADEDLMLYATSANWLTGYLLPMSMTA